MTACPACGARIVRVDGALDPATTERTFRAVRCGHTITSEQARAVWKAGVPVVVPEVDGAGLIAAERARQVAEEGHTAETDQAQTGNEIAWRAWCYLDRAVTDHADRASPPAMWPDPPQAWKPARSPLRLLTIAGALIAAEIDRRLAAGERP